MPSRPTSALRMVVSVVVVCLVSSAGLAVTYAVTKDRIAAQDQAAQQRAVRAVLPDAAAFQPISAEQRAAADKAAGEVPVYGVWTATDGSGQPAGIAVQVGPRGYGGPIQMAVGVDRTGKVTGVTIVAMNETPGLGTRVVEEPGFLRQFGGLDANDILAAVKRTDALTGATKSSRGVRHGVEAAGRVWVALEGGANP